MGAIYKKELKSYFTSMIGCVFLAIMLIIVSLYFFIVNMLNMYAEMSTTLSAITFVIVLIMPIITMKTIADENRQKTDQLLFTSPVSLPKIIAGKYLALLTLYGIGILVICTYPMIMNLYGDAQLVQSYSSIAGFFLMGAAYLAIGVFISSLTESQVIAAVISFIVMIFTYLMTSIASLIPTDHRSQWICMAILVVIIAAIAYSMMHNYFVSGALFVIGEAVFAILYFVHPSFYDGLVVSILSWLSVVDRYNSFMLGLVDISSLIYYLSVIFLFLFFTVVRIKKKRWS